MGERIGCGPGLLWGTLLGCPSDSPSSTRALLLPSAPLASFARHSWMTVPGEATVVCGLGVGDAAHSAESWEQNVSESHGPVVMRLMAMMVLENAIHDNI